MVFRNTTLGQRIGIGFASLLALTVLLSVVGLVAMGRVRNQAATLSSHYLPTLEAAQSAQRHWLLTIFQMRGYTLVHEAKYRDKGQEEMALVHQQLAEAASRAQRAGGTLAGAAQSAQAAADQAKQYQALLEQTAQLIDKIQGARVAMTKAGGLVFDESAKYHQAQEELARADVAAGADGPTVHRRMTKLNSILEMEFQLCTVRMLVWRAYAQRDMSVLDPTGPMFDGIVKKVEALRADTDREANRQQLDTIKSAVVGYRQRLEEFAGFWREAEALRPLREDLANKLLESVGHTAEESVKQASSVATTTSNRLAATVTAQTFGLVLAIFLGIAMAAGITRGICTVLGRIVAGLGHGSEQVTSASHEVASSSQQLAEGASQQAAALEETSASMEEITAASQSNAARTAECSQLAGDCLVAATTGNDAMQRMTDTMSRIKTSSEETSRILQTINAIAFQTNLLALNAAVEAARAGDAGKGFAVVAEEVRALASRSAEAAAMTTQLLDRARGEAEEGVQAVGAMGDTLERMIGHAQRVSVLLDEVRSATTEESRSIDHVTGAVAQMDQVTQVTAANAEEAAAASEELAAQARELDEMIADLERLIGGQHRFDEPPAAIEPVRTPAARPALALPPAVRERSTNGHRPAYQPVAVAELSDADISSF